ncbi:Na+-transporting methylmalonyl-CoA/oxaloacetate decarboxylase gamma subunit [Dysgonomonadaceae bacterium PH5-43]|nr:Na+-transporting methylmalonyl-CoA/oxaloacetate decarboxylase gamma subunit [Dysgonomonadaceae bacterium PH5-43]
MKQKIGFGLLLLFCTVFAAQAQRTTSLRINEVLVINENNFVDEYGQNYPWIEIFNSSAGTVDIAGCFLTTDMNNPRMYAIPKGDVLTKIKPRQHVLFWADANPWHGNFHLSFTLDANKPNFIALFDSDGRTLIDSITIPHPQKADISYGLFIDGWDQARIDKEIETNSLYKGEQIAWGYLDKVTPSTNNKILDSNEKIENFQVNDPHGVGMTVTAMLVVFLGLIVLYLAFKLTGNTAVRLSNRRAMKASGLSEEEAKDITQQSGAIYAAIAMAVYEATELHDEENTILTIKSATRNYSPWSSKIYTLRETPQKK